MVSPIVPYANIEPDASNTIIASSWQSEIVFSSARVAEEQAINTAEPMAASRTMRRAVEQRLRCGELIGVGTLCTTRSVLRNQRTAQGLLQSGNQFLLGADRDIKPVVVVRKAFGFEATLLPVPANLKSIGDDVNSQRFGQGMKFLRKSARRPAARLFAIRYQDDRPGPIAEIEDIGGIFNGRCKRRAASGLQGSHGTEDAFGGIRCRPQVELHIALLERTRSIGDQSNTTRARHLRQHP